LLRYQAAVEKREKKKGEKKKKKKKGEENTALENASFSACAAEITHFRVS